MTQATLVKKIEEKLGVNNTNAKEIYDAMISAYEEILTEGKDTEDKIPFGHLGKFEIVKKSERQGRNPRTGETIMIDAKTSVKFNPGKALKDGMNK